MKVIHTHKLDSIKILCTLFILCLVNIIFGQPEISWQKSFGGTGNDVARSIQQTVDGGYIVAGATFSSNGDVTTQIGGGDIWIIKINSLGNLEWDKSIGGSGTDEAYAIRQTSDGGYIITGMSDSNDFLGENLGNGYDDIVIIKTNSTGDMEWGHKFGSPPGERGHDVKQTPDGGYIVTGFIGGAGGISGGLWLVKLDANGNLASSWSNTTFGSAQGYSVVTTSDGGVIVTGYTSFQNNDNTYNQDARVLKLNALSEVEWDYSFGGTLADYGRSIKQTSDGGYIVAGTSQSYDGDLTNNQGGQDFWVLKLDALGIMQWQNTFGGTSEDIGIDIEETVDGGYIMTGQTNSNDGDVSGNGSGSFYDYWVIKLNSTGTLLWQKCIGGNSNDMGTAIGLTADGGYIVAGRSNSNGSGNHGLYDFFVVKLEPETLSIETNINTISFHIYPNPTSDRVLINSNANIESITVYSILGEHITTSTKKEMNLNGYASGMYLFELKTDKGNIFKKVIKN
ncbi:T9SS type A sorting domain-containing protein [Winogradskyella schleiferi]|uniref:T9SS type A sorting domain-containing protein n=1 Tax=Winogradskyella schleiferi TaxID=2686078 RepID=UPI0015B912B0|nr:T9SS type A sorting domain-containing protein [Winogradskyella schleiferi]